LAISPPSDIVLDVAKAADPSALEAARGRLEQIARSGAAPAAFSSVLGGTTADRALRDASRTGAVPETFVKFEAMVLQTFMQSILPSDTETTYGGGMAGEMWKSLLAEQLGEVLARRGGIGIADRILADHYLDGEKKVPVSGVSQGTAKQYANEQTALSNALVQESQRSFVQSVGQDHSGASAAAGRRK
jgi:Rod binding domain-containing protein